MRQCAIYIRTQSQKQFERLDPAKPEDVEQFSKAEIATAANVMIQHPTIEAVVVRLNGTLFNLVSFEQDAEAPKAISLTAKWKFPETSNAPAGRDAVDGD